MKVRLRERREGDWREGVGGRVCDRQIKGQHKQGGVRGEEHLLAQRLSHQEDTHTHT